MKNNKHWFFDLLEILFNADKSGDGLTWDIFWNKFKLIKNEKIVKEHKDYIKSIFFEVSESCQEIENKSRKDSKEKFKKKSFIHLQTKMYERYVGYLELQEAYKSSKESKKLSWIAIGISIFLGVSSVFASFMNACYSKKQLKITQKQIDAKIVLSKNIKKKLNSIENNNRLIVEKLKNKTKNN